MKNYIVTVTAADQVGIVHTVAGTLRARGGNILELSQTVMRGYFTIILEVEFRVPLSPKALAGALTADGEKYDLTVAVIETDERARQAPVSDGERFILTVLGDDAAGNIHGIAGCLSARGVNIVDLHARVDGTRFSLVMEAFLPSDLSPAVVRADLEEFGKDHGLEVFVQHENIFQATSEPGPVRVGGPLRIQGDAVVPH
jgi:glycine cleavage system transcriptional repressor